MISGCHLSHVLLQWLYIGIANCVLFVCPVRRACQTCTHWHCVSADCKMCIAGKEEMIISGLVTSMHERVS